MSPAVHRLLADVIDSFEKLELVVHLHRAPNGHSTEEIGQAIGLAHELAADALAALTAAEVIKQTRAGGAGVRWILDPGGKWTANVSALVQAYEADRIVVHDAMTRLALQRIRSQAAQLFADAFLLRPRKRKRDG